MSFFRWLLLPLGILPVLVCLPEIASAEDDQAVADRRNLAVELAREGRCENALDELIAVRISQPQDAEVAELLGECGIRLQQFDLAARALESARELDPATPKVDLHLGMAYFHLGDLDRAEEALERAQSRDPKEPEFLLYAGLLSLSQANYERAIGRLSAASQLSDRPVEPMASFYLGRAFRQAEDREKAEAAFLRVIRDAPETVWAEEAQRAIDELRDEQEIKVWSALEIGFEHDDNVLLLGRGVVRPEDISGQSDQRGFWFVDAGALLLRTDAWQGGLAFRYGGSEHAKLNDYDAHGVGGTVWLDRALGIADSTLRVEANFDATWIDEDPFLYSFLWRGLIHKPWKSGGYTVFSVAVGIDDYRYDLDDITGPDGPPGINEKSARDRDGQGVTASLLHRENLPIELDWLGTPWVESEYLYNRYESEGSEYDHERHQLELGLGAELPFAIQLSVRGRYAYVPYGNPTTFPDPSDIGASQPYFLDHRRRREQETSVRVLLERAFGEHVVVSTRWTRTRNRSTADSFDYTRDLFGLSVRIGFGN